MVRDSLPHTLVSTSADPQVAEVICVLNGDGVIQFATPAAAQFLGYDPAEIVGRSALSFVTPDTYNATNQRWNALRDNLSSTTSQMMLMMVAASGRQIPIRATVWRLPNRNEFLLVLQMVEYLQDRLETLYSILNNVSGRLAVNSVLDTVQREVFRLIPSSVCSVLLTENDTTMRIRQWDQTEMREYWLPLEKILRFETTQIMCETGQPIIIDDTETDPRWMKTKNHAQNRTVRSWLGVPLIHHDQFLGELNLDSPEPNAFNKQDAELALALAGQLAATVFQARQFEAEQRRAKRFSVLNDISQAISHLDLDSVLELVYRKLSQLMDTSTFFIGLYDAEAEIVRLVGAYDYGEKSPDTIQRADAGITGLVLRTRENLITLDTHVDPLPDVAIVRNEMPRSLLMMPLITQDGTVGVISVQSYEPDAYTEDDISMLETIAGAVATAVRNAQLYDQTIERFAALEILHQMSLDLATAQEPSAIAQRVAQAALELLRPSAAWLILCHDHLGEAGKPSGHTTMWTTYAGGDLSQPRVEARTIPTLHPLVAQVRDTGQSVLIMDMTDETMLQREFDTPWLVHAAAIYPIQRGDQLFAVVALLYAEPTFFRQDMLRTLDLLALEAATAFQNVRYLATLRRQLSEVTALQDLARQVSALRSLDAVLHNVVHTLQAVYQCKSVWVALLDTIQEMVSIRAATGLKLEYAEQIHFPVGEHVAGQVVETGEPVYVPDMAREPKFRIIDPSVRSMMVVPLTVHGRVLGALGIDSVLPNAFEEGHKRVLNIAGGQIAATIETIHLLKQTQDRAEDLEAANTILQEQDKLRQELVHQVSHDLRSPLQLVYGYADMMHGGFLGDVTPSQMDILDLMMARIKAIEMMTRDIMTAKSISRDMLELEPIELNAMCQQAIVDIRLLNKHRSDLYFETALVTEKLEIEADQVRLRRVLDNLLVNAVKFSPEGGLIKLRTERDIDTGHAVIMISDQGIGIPEDKLPLIFESFFKVAQKKFEGSGLGLYIVQQIVEAHHGEVRVESTLGKGSTFIVTLPLLEEGE